MSHCILCIWISCMCTDNYITVHTRSNSWLHNNSGQFTVLLCELPVVGEESTTMTIVVKGQRWTTRGFCFYKRADHAVFTNTHTHWSSTIMFCPHRFKTNQKYGCTTASYLYMAMDKARGIQVLQWLGSLLATDNYYKQHFHQCIVLVTMMSCLCVWIAIFI